MAEWLALMQILEVYNGYMGYEVGGSHREPWWRKTADLKQMSATLEDILAVARVRLW